MAADLFVPLSLSAQTAYAQLLENLQWAEMSRSVADAPGSFNCKTVSGKRYWYYQYRDLNNKLCQAYLGPDSPQLEALVAQRSAASANGPDPAQQQVLAQSANKLGCMTVSLPHLRIIRRLGDAGFFRAGGVLVGTHAFLCAGNMLGVRWGDASRTQDLDFAHAGKNMQVALRSTATLDLGGVIESLQMGFVPTSSLDGIRGGRWVNPKDPAFMLDFLTPMDRTEKELVHVAAFGAEFQALRFMEFSLEDVQTAAVFSGTQACLVNIPSPARMAVHKLIVSGLRSTSLRTKASKDIQQAAMLWTWYEQNDPAAFARAEEDARARGPKWRKHLDEGQAQMQRFLQSRSA